MKIYEIGTGYTPIPAQMGAATEIVVEELVKAFQKLDVDVELLDIQAEQRKENQLPITEVHVPGCFSGTDVKLGLIHKLKRVVYSVALAGKLRRILKASKEQVVLHFHNQYNLYFFLKLSTQKRRKNCMIAYTNHSHIWHGAWDEIAPIVRKRYFQEVYCMKRADRVFVLNQATVDNIVTNVGIKKEKVILIDNGVNTQVYCSLPDEDRSRIHEESGLSGKRVFIQVGSVCERKNQLGALRLLLPFLKENKEIVFCYAGGVISEEYQNAIDRFAEENGVQDQVRYFGELVPGDTLNAFYNLADAMIFPSLAEGFSLVILEAMAAGVPVVINSNLQFQLANECLRFSDEQGFGDLLREQILNENNRSAQSRKVRQAVEMAYGWNKIAKDYLTGYFDKKE